MKKSITIGLIVFVVACHPQKNSPTAPPIPAYAPGLGEFMSRMQAHHIKLWYAGKAENWKLADFEIKRDTGIYRGYSKILYRPAGA